MDFAFLRVMVSGSWAER